MRATPDPADKASFIARMRGIVERVGGVSEMARLTGLSRRAVQNYLTGSNDPSREVLVRMARAAGVGVGWLAVGEEAAAREDGFFAQIRASAEYAFVPMLAPTPEGGLDLDAQAAFGGVFVDRRWLMTQLGIAADRAILFSSPDDQMAPTILPGCIMLVDTGDHSPDNGIYLIQREGKMGIKRLQASPEGILVSSDNPHYQPYRLPREAAVEELKVVGRIRVLWRPWRL